VHRDFHPGNVLWRRHRVTGVVDWANACRGPWDVDVVHCRTNLIGLSRVEAADRFEAAYRSETGRVLDPYWEMAAVLESGGDRSTPVAVARDEARLERALVAMGISPA
jgi:aminoglycoside phosphotransferase (APT) family kinase protein